MKTNQSHLSNALKLMKDRLLWTRNVSHCATNFKSVARFVGSHYWCHTSNYRQIWLPNQGMSFIVLINIDVPMDKTAL